MGFKLQFTPVLLKPVTVGVNCWVCDACKLVLPGLSDTPAVGWRVTCALPDFVVSAALVAVMVMTCDEGMDAGAV